MASLVLGLTQPLVTKPVAVAQRLRSASVTPLPQPMEDSTAQGTGHRWPPATHSHVHVSFAKKNHMAQQKRV